MLLVPEDEGGFSVLCPSLPGCVSQGETEAEALENIASAIAEYLEVREEMLAEAHGKRFVVQVGVA